MPLKVRRRPRAAEDVLDIWEYVAGDSMRSADALVDAFEDRFRLLASYPAAGMERPDLGDGLRSIPHGRFLIFYRFGETDLEIIRVVAAARKLTPELFEP